MRLLLDDTLRTTAEFDAFCLDYFPLVWRRFSPNMDRVEKTTLLLALEPNSLKIARHLQGNSSDIQIPSSAKSYHSVGLALAIIILIIITGVGGLTWNQRHVTPPFTVSWAEEQLVSSHPVQPSQASIVNSITDNEILNSANATIENKSKYGKGNKNRGNRIIDSPGATIRNQIN